MSVREAEHDDGRRAAAEVFLFLRVRVRLLPRRGVREAERLPRPRGEVLALSVEDADAAVHRRTVRG